MVNAGRTSWPSTGDDKRMTTKARVLLITRANQTSMSCNREGIFLTEVKAVLEPQLLIVQTIICGRHFKWRWQMHPSHYCWKLRLAYSTYDVLALRGLRSKKSEKKDFCFLNLKKNLQKTSGHFDISIRATATAWPLPSWQILPNKNKGDERFAQKNTQQIMAKKIREKS